VHLHVKGIHGTGRHMGVGEPRILRETAGELIEAMRA